MQSTFNKRSINLFQGLILFVITVSISSVGLLCLHYFKATYALVLGSILFLSVILILRPRFALPDQATRRTGAIAFLILFMALFFRAEPYLYLMGGQDEGIYVNMSSTYEKTGSTFVTDHVREKLDDSQKAIYDKTNLGLPGIYVKDLTNSEYVFQFYPLHPLWMAIFGKIFGEDNRVYSLVFFSLISISSFLLLTFEISNGKKVAAYFVALFLALNPLHVFFSKFPVSEMVVLAFSSTGFYFLVKYYKEAEKNNVDFFYLILSAGSFLCLFLTNISAFLYLPFFYLLSSLTIFVLKPNIKTDLAVYCLLLYGCLALSMSYGLKYSFPYSSTNYSIFFGPHWKLVLILFYIFPIALYLVISQFKNYLLKLILKNASVLFTILSYIFVIVVVIALFQAYQFSFTSKYVETNNNTLFPLAFQGFKSLSAVSIFVVISYLSPLGFLLLFLSLNHARKSGDIIIFGLVFFLCIAWAIKVAYNSTVLYQFYYARYLLSEVIPYSLLLVSLYLCYLFERNVSSKIISSLSALGMAFYFLYFTSFQLSGREAEGADVALSRIKEKVGHDDLLLMYSQDRLFSIPSRYAHHHVELKTPLVHYYGVNAMNVNNLDFVKNPPSFFTDYNNIFFLSRSPVGGFSLVETIDYKQGIMEHANFIPKEFSLIEADLYLYKVSKTGAKASILATGKIVPSQHETSNFYDNDLWTKGDGYIRGLHYKISPEIQYLVINTMGFNPLRNDLARLKLRIFVDGRELIFVRQQQKAYYFSLQKDMKEINEIRVNSSTFVPKEFGINDDNRRLGIDVESIEILAR